MFLDDASALDGFAYKFSARRENEELENNNFFNMRRSEIYFYCSSPHVEKVAFITNHFSVADQENATE